MYVPCFNTPKFPNPFINKTQFSFEVTQDFDLNLDLYTLGGRRVWSYKQFNLVSGFHAIDWDGRDSFGKKIANGVYIFRIKVIGKNSTVSYIGKCAKYD